MLRNRITYIFAVAILLLLVFTYESSMTYAALYTVLALPLLSLGLTLLSKRQFLIFERLSQADVLKGEEVQYIISLKNNSFMPAASVRIQFKASSTALEADFVDQYISIKPYKTQETIFNIKTKYRGHYEVGIADVILYDFLGLFKFKQAHNKTLLLTVRPHVVTLRHMPLVITQEGSEDSRNFTFDEDYAIISDLRKYQPTDGYKKIHWKATAKKNELISKNYQRTKRNTTAFIIENSGVLDGGYQLAKSEAAAALEDAMMQDAVSAIAQCVQRKNLCAMYFMGGGYQAYSGDSGRLYEIASGIRFEKFTNGDFENFLDAYVQMQVNAENVIMIVSEISLAVSQAAQMLKFFGNNVIIRYARRSMHQADDILTELMQKGVHCLQGGE